MLFSCAEDKGTYNYVDLNEVEIDGMEEKYVAIKGAPFSIQPEVSQKLTDDESVLEYLWYIYDSSSGADDVDTIATTKEFISDSVEIARGRYNLVYKVTDNSTGIYYDYRSDLKVNGFADGLQILSNTEGNAQLSVIREAGESDYEAYKLKNGVYAGKNPVAIKATNEMWGNVPHVANFLIACDDETMGVCTDKSDLLKESTLKDYFRVDPPSNVQGLYSELSTGAKFIGLFGDDKMYTSYKPGWMPSIEFTTEFEENLCIDLVLANSWTTFMFDNNTTGYVAFDAYGSRATPLKGNDEDAFDVGNTGLTALYGKLMGDKGVGIFVDEVTQEKYMLSTTLNFNSLTADGKLKMEGEGLDETTKYELANNREVAFYAVGNKFYTYDFGANRVMYTYEFPEGTEVDHFEISNDDKRMFVGVSDGTKAAKSGSLLIIGVDNDGELLDILESHENICGQVVDINDNTDT